MKPAMLTWVRSERPEIARNDTWNEHMIAIKERLGAVVVARRQSFFHDR